MKGKLLVIGYIALVLILGVVMVMAIRGEVETSVPEPGVYIPPQPDTVATTIDISPTASGEAFTPEVPVEYASAPISDAQLEIEEGKEPDIVPEPVIVDDPGFDAADVDAGLRHMTYEMLYLPNWVGALGDTFTATTAAYTLNNNKVPYSIKSVSEDFYNIYCVLSTETGDISVHFSFQVGDETICEMDFGGVIFHANITNIQFSSG